MISDSRATLDPVSIRAPRAVVGAATIIIGLVLLITEET
jgi:hypothetical protein